MEIVKPTKNNLEKIIKAINNGGVVVCPTDTVYGFLADASNAKAVAKIFKIKKRPKNKTLPIFVKDLKMAKEIAEILPAQEKILKSKWPGKHTFVLQLKNKTKLCKYVTANKTVAMRVPKYKFLNNLLKKINRPLAQTSVNVSNQNQLPLARASEIISQFGGNKLFSLIIDAGNLPKSKSSTIMDLTGNKINILRK